LAKWEELATGMADTAAAAAAVAATAHVTLRPGGSKRSFPFQGDETLEFMPLGGGNEVRRGEFWEPVQVARCSVLDGAAAVWA
jgi:hypothetical protein